MVHRAPCVLVSSGPTGDIYHAPALFRFIVQADPSLSYQYGAKSSLDLSIKSLSINHDVASQARPPAIFEGGVR